MDKERFATLEQLEPTRFISIDNSDD